MKSVVYEVRGCSGSFKEVTVSEHATLADARVESKKRNQHLADRRGIDLKDLWSDQSQFEGTYGAKGKGQ